MVASPAFVLHLLRHAHSSWAVAGERDHLRCLDGKGRRQVARLCERLAGRVSDLRCIVCSSAVRALETLAGVQASLPADVRIEFSDELYALGPQAYAQAGARLLASGPTLLVGHNPSIESFARALLRNDAAGRSRLSEGYGTARWASIEVAFDENGDPDMRNGRLREWIEP